MKEGQRHGRNWNVTNEQRVMVERLVLKGFPLTYIAREMHMSPETVWYRFRGELEPLAARVRLSPAELKAAIDLAVMRSMMKEERRLLNSAARKAL